ncbi:trehalose-phosphatase-domain-containing protein [Radiomyces spectabilis]|uniref:trehalose-phosphatase-domain-containing protein n=1 Tax=Radiomyces spectabilis TaxID=64574 RepID=UPI002220305C|nr:trehalose-phosphatase-domain-containing protein [Radiomyces spectabilis]KAI8394082.1 trehalose-phosphatase-domain-containing protein [Radiomyces spectabilis]
MPSSIAYYPLPNLMDTKRTSSSRCQSVHKHFGDKRIVLCQNLPSSGYQATYNLFFSKYPYWRDRIVVVHINNDASVEVESSDSIYHYQQQKMDKEDYENMLAAADIGVIFGNDAEMIRAFVTYHRDHHAPLILSANVASPLAAAKEHAIMVDESDKEAVADALDVALQMSAQEAKQRYEGLYRSVTQQYTDDLIPHHAQPLNTTTLMLAYKSANKRLFLFDYDGTLTPIVRNPADACPTPTLLNYLKHLCTDQANSVWIISGRDQVFLNTYLGNIQRLNLSAEHGSFMKIAGEQDWIDMLKDADMQWKDVALEIFEKYTAKLPGTNIEKKKSSITWHYRNAVDSDEAYRQSKLCHKELMQIPGVDILVGKMNLEVRSHLVNKGEVVKRIKTDTPEVDFIMCAGDDQTDEDMFRALLDDKKAFTVSIGPSSKPTLAGWCVESSEQVVDLLGQLSE